MSLPTFDEEFNPGLDFEWFTVDADGQFALLTSAGFGPVPVAVFRFRHKYEAVRACLLGPTSGQPSK